MNYVDLCARCGSSLFDAVTLSQSLAEEKEYMFGEYKAKDTEQS